MPLDYEQRCELAARQAGWDHGGDGDGIIFRPDVWGSWKPAINWAWRQSRQEHVSPPVTDDGASPEVYETWQECCEVEGIEVPQQDDLPPNPAAALADARIAGHEAAATIVPGWRGDPPDHLQPAADDSQVTLTRATVLALLLGAESYLASLDHYREPDDRIQDAVTATRAAVAEPIPIQPAERSVESDSAQEARMQAEDAGENLRLIDWIANRIGLAHDKELSRENFAAWQAHGAMQCAAHLREAIDAWPQFDGEAEVSGADLVDWFTGWRERAKAALGDHPPPAPESRWQAMAEVAAARASAERDAVAGADWNRIDRLSRDLFDALPRRAFGRLPADPWRTFCVRVAEGIVRNARNMIIGEGRANG